MSESFNRRSDMMDGPYDFRRSLFWCVEGVGGRGRDRGEPQGGCSRGGRSQGSVNRAARWMDGGKARGITGSDVLSLPQEGPHFSVWLTRWMKAPSIEPGVAGLGRKGKNIAVGVPVMSQWLTNPTRNHEVAGSIPGLAQWVKDPALPWDV